MWGASRVPEDEKVGTMSRSGEGRLAALAQKWQAAIDGSRRAYYGSFVALFVVFLCAFMFGYLVNGRGFIWSVDGLEQQYLFFVLQGEWLREFLSNIFITHTFVVPMWTDQVGYGADYIVSIGNTLGDPILWLSVFATAENADLLLQATVPITLFLAGLVFLGYCSYKGFDRFSSLIGSMVFLFGGYSLIAYSQIFMVYPLLLGPLVLWGVDKVFDRKSPVLLIFALFLCFFNAVSQAYEVCLILLVYCLVKVFNLPERTTPKSFGLWVAKIIGCIALAALLAAIVFYPSALSLLSQGRLGLSRYESLTYSFVYYLQLLEGFIYPVYVGADCYYGFAPLALLAVFGLFFTKNLDIEVRTKRILRILFVVMTLFLCLPIVGRVFNGFAYANNRWVWAYCLLVSLIVVMLLSSLRAAIQKGDRRVLAGAVIYALVCLVVLAWYTNAVFYGMLALLFATAAALYALRDKRAVLNVTLVGLVGVGCFFVSYQHGLTSQVQVGLGKSYDYAVTFDASSLIKQLPDYTTERYDSADTHVWRNGNIASGALGSTFYNSFYNGAVDDYHTSLGLATSSMNFSYSTLNSRTVMEALAGVKYFVAPPNDAAIPPLYRTQVASGDVKGDTCAVYQAAFTLPLAFTYDRSIARADYDAMSIAQRQDALAQAVVVDDPATDAAGSLASYTQEVPSTLSLEKAGSDALSIADGQSLADKQAGVAIDGTTITVTKPNTVLYLNADIPAGTEAYFMCTGMDYTPLDEQPSTTVIPAQATGAAATGLGIKQKIDATLTDLSTEPARDCKILVGGVGTSEEIWYMNNRHHLYGGKDDWAVNVGYSGAERHAIALQFCNAGTYTFSDLGVYAQDSAQVEGSLSTLAAAGATDIQKLDNGYACTAQAADDGQYLYFRIPYAEGWSATVDGQPAQIEQANVGFMAVKLDAGSHQVELQYETPNLCTGAVLSCVGMLLAVGIVIVSKKRRAKA